jgi:hypothetical protein
MSESLLQHLIDSLLDGVDGEVTSRSRVVDGLLDLRLAATEMPHVVQACDRSLSDLPGKTTVTNLWWLETLEELRNAVVAAPAGA